MNSPTEDVAWRKYHVLLSDFIHGPHSGCGLEGMSALRINLTGRTIVRFSTENLRILTYLFREWLQQTPQPGTTAIDRCILWDRSFLCEHTIRTTPLYMGRNINIDTRLAITPLCDSGVMFLQWLKDELITTELSRG